MVWGEWDPLPCKAWQVAGLRGPSLPCVGWHCWVSAFPELGLWHGHCWDARARGSPADRLGCVVRAHWGWNSSSSS